MSFCINSSLSSMKFVIFKRAIPLLLILAVAQSSFAQLDTRSFFSVTGGYSLPVGEMATEKLNDPLAGLAGSGYFGQANYDFRIFRWAGLRLSGSLNVNTTNSDPIVDKANTYVQALNRTYTWQSDVSQWKLAAVLVGPAIYLNMNRVQLEAHLQGGMIRANTPSVILTGQEVNPEGGIIEGGQPISVSLNHATVKPYAFGAGVSLRFPLVRALYFQLSGDVIGAKAEVKDLAIKAKSGAYEFSDQINEKRFVGVVNIGAGLGIAF
jgi:hypothetical protein